MPTQRNHKVNYSLPFYYRIKTLLYELTTILPEAEIQ